VKVGVFSLLDDVPFACDAEQTSEDDDEDEEEKDEGGQAGDDYEPLVAAQTVILRLDRS